MGRVKLAICLTVACVMPVANLASADTIRGINIDFVSIGNAGNVADTQVMSDGTTGYGSVGYNYRIGKYEVTNAQWNTFTANAGTPTVNGYGGINGYDSYFTGAQQPANNASWFETLQFCNYLTSGDKSKGAYLFSGNNTNPGSFLGVDRAMAQMTYSTVYFLPTENEWYKAAYFKPNGSGYSLYANGKNTAPIAGLQSNYNNPNGAPWNMNTGVQEQNGTFDIMGNLWEWNETVVQQGTIRGLRGGSYCYGYDGGVSNFGLASSFRGCRYPSYESYGVGFRVASVPEPATMLLLGLGGLVLRRRHRG